MVEMYGHEISPMALYYRPLSPEAFERLKESIANVGQQVGIGRRDSVIYNGVHRLRACHELGIEPWFVEIGEEVDLTSYVIAMNDEGRKNSPDDKIVTAFLFSEGARPGRPKSGRENEVNLPRFPTVKETSIAFGLSESKLKQVRRVLRKDGNAAPELRDAVLEWRIKYSDAARIVNLPKLVQREAVKRKQAGIAKTVRAAAKDIEDKLRDSAQTKAAKELQSRPLDERVAVHHCEIGGLRGLVEEGGVHLIATFPPAGQKWVENYRALGEFAVHALAPEGILAVVADPDHLPTVMRYLNVPGLEWLTEMDYRFPGRPTRSPHPNSFVRSRWPVLLYGRPGCPITEGSDFVSEPSPKEPGVRGALKDPQVGGMVQLLRRLVERGRTVCDPAMGHSPCVARAAIEHKCHFVGATENKWDLQNIMTSLNGAGETRRAQTDARSGHGGGSHDETRPTQSQLWV